MDGTFSFAAGTGEVTFEPATETFVRDMTFTARRANGAVQLEGQESFGSVTLRVVLR